MSRRLGYRTNVAYAWESGRRSPGAAEVFRIAARLGFDVRAAVEAFHRSAVPAWLADSDVGSPEFVTAFLRDLKGRLSIQLLAERTGHSRYAISRWLSGRAQPRLPEFFALVDAASLRVLDLIAGLVDPATLPAAAARWAQLCARRETAWQLPWSHAVLRALELEDYAALEAHQPGWIAGQVGISLEEEGRCLGGLADAGLITWDGRRYRAEELTVDTSANPDAARAARKQHRLDRASAAHARGAPGLYSYNVFSVSAADMDRLRDLHVQYFTALRSVVAASAPAQRVGVVSMQLFELRSPLTARGRSPLTD